MQRPKNNKAIAMLEFPIIIFVVPMLIISFLGQPVHDLLHNLFPQLGRAGLFLATGASLYVGTLAAEITAMQIPDSRDRTSKQTKEAIIADSPELQQQIIKSLEKLISLTPEEKEPNALRENGYYERLIDQVKVGRRTGSVVHMIDRTVLTQNSDSAELRAAKIELFDLIKSIGPQKTPAQKATNTVTAILYPIIAFVLPFTAIAGILKLCLSNKLPEKDEPVPHHADNSNTTQSAANFIAYKDDWTKRYKPRDASALLSTDQETEPAKSRSA